MKDYKANGDTKLITFKQYSRHENIRIHGVLESKKNKDDGEAVLLDIATALDIEIYGEDIQRAHRLGKKKKNFTAKPRPTISRFVSYKKRNEFLFAKSKLGC